ncbi:MAG: hypothetical protein M1840_000105 [Geoglossum simile]|nr:MAG: hypothetical protein M1840_000105 [Geoglossum simile]
MSAQNGSAVTGDCDVDIIDAPAIDKGKGKAVPYDVEEDDTSEEETADEGIGEPEVDEEEDDDDMAEIDTGNIIMSGRRTRGKTIDFAKAAQEEGAPEEDEDDDGDFEVVEEDEDAMQE